MRLSVMVVDYTVGKFFNELREMMFTTMTSFPTLASRASGIGTEERVTTISRKFDLLQNGLKGYEKQGWFSNDGALKRLRAEFMK